MWPPARGSAWVKTAVVEVHKARHSCNHGKVDISIELLIRIYNDAEVQTQLRKTVDPLHVDGFEEYQTRRDGKVVDSVSKRDLNAADEAELEDLTRNEEIKLDIEKAAWRRNLAWHFSDRRTSFDAKIEDEELWKSIEEGEAFQTVTA